MIDLMNLGEMTYNEILNLVRLETENVIQISIPKDTQLFFSESAAIANDYIKLAYAGQCLSEVSSFFKYEQINPREPDDVLFEIKTYDSERLAEVLLQLTYLYGINDDEEDDTFSQLESVSQFLSDVDNRKIEPACGYFVNVSKEFAVNDKKD